MPDQYDPKVAPRTPGRREAPADDPLAELAKIVHGRPTVASAAAAKGPSRSQPVNGAAANDLEAELLNDLQASFAAVRDALPVTPLAAPQPKPAPAALIAAPSLRGPIVEDTPAAAAPPPASVTPPQPSPFRVPSPQAAAAQPAAPQPTPARTAAPRPDATPRPELRDEFRLEPINESRLVPIPSPPVIQPQIQQTSDYQPAARAERPSLPERRVEPGPIDEKPADAGVERAPRAARPATPPEPPSDLANFTIRTATRSAAAASAPASLPGAARQPHSRWEKPEPAKPQPSAPSRFAPPKSAAAEDDADRDPFADAGLLPGEDGDAGLDAEFPLDGLGMVPGYGDDDDVDMLPPLDDDLDALAKP
ncbi:MAG TPA: hypothetical protein VG894_05510, partial [Bauldia sp.]|nr:hypothetical protein [Bauldia sp.]